MIAATPPPTPVVKLGTACRAASIHITIKLDRKTYVLHTIELCGKTVRLYGRPKK